MLAERLPQHLELNESANELSETLTTRSRAGPAAVCDPLAMMCAASLALPNI